MQIDWGAIVGIAGVVFGIVFGYVAYQKGLKTDSKETGEKEGIVLTQLGYINKGIDTINEKLDKQKDEFRDLSIKVGEIEQCAKSAHKRLDEHMQGRI